MNKLLMVLFLSGVVFGMMALMPEGQPRNVRKSAEISTDRGPSAFLPQSPDAIAPDPASGEPSDNGLTSSLHREFRDALDRDPMVAIELARQLVFTRELDSSFRLEILRELKILQFTHPEVSELAGDILEKAPDPALFEEALTIKYASMEAEEFESLVSEMADKTEAPEYQVILKNFGSSVN